MHAGTAVLGRDVHGQDFILTKWWLWVISAVQSSHFQYESWVFRVYALLGSLYNQIPIYLGEQCATVTGTAITVYNQLSYTCTMYH